MKIRTKLLLKRFFKEQLWQLLIVVAFLLISAFVFEKYIESVMFCIAHTVIRNKFNKQYHSNSVAICLCLTLGIAWVSIANTLPIGISIISTIPICFLVAYIGFIAQDRVDLILYKKQLKKQLEELTSEKPFNTDNCTLEELLVRCKELKFSEYNTQLCVELFINRTKQSALADRLCIEEKSVQQQKRRLKQKLNK